MSKKGVQIIEKDGKPEWAVVPYARYERLVADAEKLRDIRDYDEAKKRIEAGEETIPADVVHRIVDGENPIRVWREYRKLTQQELAERARISKGYLSQLESGEREGTVKVLKALAAALDVELEHLIAPHPALSRRGHNSSRPFGAL